MKRKHLVVAGLAAFLAGLLVWLLFLRGEGDGGSGAAGGPGRAGPRAVPPHIIDRQQELQAAALRTADPPDPAGTLLLEGQVLGENDEPVGGAEVWISTVPPRKATTEGDGGFSFDKLLPREYSLGARHEDAVGGPVTVPLGPGAEPVVIRLREGATLRVRVTRESDGTAVAGAAVQLRDLDDRTVATDAEGVASFRGLGAGWSVVEVRADGFAPVTAIATIGAPGTQQELAVVLRTGAAISGKVVDDQGAPIAGAYVQLRDVGALWSFRSDATTSGADGAFTFPVISAGSYTIAARDGEHAPGASEILTVDGVHPKDGVTIVLGPAGVIRGRVITRQRQPAPFASVEVAPKGQDASGVWWGFSDGGRRVTADQAGQFEIRGLPRAAVRVRAENDVAASAISDVDLAVQAVVADLELMLDVEGVIAGVVVDSAGEPVAEAQVTALADFFGGEQKLDDIAFSGLSSATTDGGGAFRVRGLPDGTYRLWASRTGVGAMSMFASEGTKAKTGDTQVRIVLPAPGGIEGKIAFSDGAAPKLATVSVSALPSSPVTDGSFELRDLAPGTYDLRVRGPDFAEHVQRGVVVQTGAVNDIGTITVKRGRKVSGRVVDGDGKPVAGARVVVGSILFSEGSAGGNALLEEQMGQRSGVSDADGGFVVQGAPEKGGSAMAEHVDLGRSGAVAIPPGDTDVPGLVLALRGFGSIAGKVTSEGKPVPSVQVMASEKGTSGHLVMVATGGDGSFVIDKIPAGTHRLTANRMANMQMSSTSAEVTVVAGQRATVELKFTAGTIALTVEIKGEGGAKIDAAQIFLFPGSVAARNAKDLTDRFIAGEALGMNFWFGTPTFPRFEKQLPGRYTICVLPINGSIADPQFQQRLQDNLDKLDVHCDATTLTASPTEQKHVAVVPPMSPLPAE